MIDTPAAGYIEFMQGFLWDILSKHHNADEIAKILERPPDKQSVERGIYDTSFLDELEFPLNITEKDRAYIQSYLDLEIAKNYIGNLIRDDVPQHLIVKVLESLFFAGNSLGIYSDYVRTQGPIKAAAAKNKDKEPQYKDAVAFAKEKLRSGEWPNSSVKKHGAMAKAAKKEHPSYSLGDQELRKRIRCMIEKEFPERAAELIRMPNPGK